MDESYLPVKFPIKRKIAYIKLLFLNDSSVHKKPLFQKPIRGSKELKNIYDSAIFYVWTQLANENLSAYKLKFTSTKGKIDDVLQVYPFNLQSAYHPDPAEKSIHQLWEVPITPTSDNTLVVAHHYNAFQKEGGEWAGVRTDENTEELRLIVDFNSVITKKEKEKQLFEDPPVAYLVDPNEKKSESAVVCNDNGRVFSAVENSVQKGYVLKFEWKINWNNLAKLKSTYKLLFLDKSFVSKIFPI